MNIELSNNNQKIRVLIMYINLSLSKPAKPISLTILKISNSIPTDKIEAN